MVWCEVPLPFVGCVLFVFFGVSRGNFLRCFSYCVFFFAWHTQVLTSLHRITHNCKSVSLSRLASIFFRLAFQVRSLSLSLSAPQRLRRLAICCSTFYSSRRTLSLSLVLLCSQTFAPGGPESEATAEKVGQGAATGVAEAAADAGP